MDVVGVATQLGDFLTAGDVEKADGVVAAAGGQPRAVGAERHAVDNTPHGHDRELPVGLRVPEADGLVLGARGQQFAVGVESYPVDSATVSAQDCDQGAGGDVPETNCPVCSGGGEQAAVGMEFHVNAVFVVTLESDNLPSRGHVPESHWPLSGPCCQQCPRRVEGGPASLLDSGGYERRIANGLLGRHIPERDAPFLLQRGKSVTVTTVGHRMDNPRLVLQ